MTRLVFITSKASRSRISSRAFADYVEEDASMPNQLASTPWTSSTGSGTVSEADEKGGPSKGGEESERANDFFRFASDLMYPRSVHSSGRMVHSSLTVSQVPLTRALARAKMPLFPRSLFRAIVRNDGRAT